MIIQQSVTDPLKKEIMDGFSRHSLAATGFNEISDPVAFTAHDGEMLIGAAIVAPFWGALHIKNLYVHEKYRGEGWGGRLLQRALEFGKERQLPFAFVETMSFQALDFYRKMGFELEFTRPGYAHGASFHYLRKSLID